MHTASKGAGWNKPAPFVVQRIVPYRSSDGAVARALEEQREIQAMARAAARRRRRVWWVLGGVQLCAIGIAALVGSRWTATASHAARCHRVTLEYEPESYTHPATGEVVVVQREPRSWLACQ